MAFILYTFYNFVFVVAVWLKVNWKLNFDQKGPESFPSKWKAATKMQVILN